MALLIALSGCINTNKQEKQQDYTSKIDSTVMFINSNNNNSKLLINRGNDISAAVNNLINKSRANFLNQNMENEAIHFCTKNALRITDSIAKAKGVEIKRLAKKNRNPENAMNAKESEIYKQYIINWLSNKPLTANLSIDENGHPVYYKLIFTRQSCLACHGSIENDINAETYKLITEQYPVDKAIDFKVNQPRGMISITFSDITVDIAK